VVDGGNNQTTKQRKIVRELGAARAIVSTMFLAAAALAACDAPGPPDVAAVTLSPPVNRESHGAFFPIGAGTFHVALSCGNCHGDDATFATFTCTSCHAHDGAAAAARHTFITGYQWDSTACRKCHPAGQEADISPGDHTAKYFPIATGSHAKAACADCHPFATTSKTFTCTNCHADDETQQRAHATTPSYRFDSFACYGCHPKG
jgi:hypothetical protein